MVLVVDAHEADGAPEVGRPPAPGYLESQHLAIKVDGAIDIADLDADVPDPAQMNAHAVLLASRRATLPRIATIIGARAGAMAAVPCPFHINPWRLIGSHARLVDMRSPVRPHVGADHPASRADHAPT